MSGLHSARPPSLNPCSWAPSPSPELPCVCVFARIGSSVDSCGFRVLWTQISVKYLEAEAQLGKAETHADLTAAYALLLSFSLLYFFRLFDCTL